MITGILLPCRRRSDAVRSIADIAEESNASRQWQLVGAAGTVTAFLILSFYSVIGGWALAYSVASSATP
jgi:NSS family neurotransmitter:Na+ symporter